MVAIRVALTIVLLSCSPSTEDSVRVPENWTLDKNAMHTDLRDGLLSESEKHAFELIAAEYRNSDADGIEEGVVAPADNLEAIAEILDSYHEAIAINKTLWQALLDYEDSTCFQRRKLKRLEVHLRARAGFQRQAQDFPEVELKLGLANQKDQTAEIIDGGATVYASDFAEPRLNSMGDIAQITFKRLNASTYDEVDYPYGQGYCTERALWGTGWCKKDHTVYDEDTYYIEGQTVIIDGVDIYAQYPNDSRKYLIYSSLPAENPLATLSGITPIYSVPSFRNNPHWVLHYHSANCDGWSNANHDGSDFGREIWDKYASKGKPIGSNAERKIIACKDKRITGITVMPPELVETVDELADKLPANVWDKSLPELRTDSRHTCDPIDVNDLIKEAKEKVDTLVLDADRLKFDFSADYEPEVLQEKRTYLAQQLDTFISNSSAIDNYNANFQIGCFYDRELVDGINVEVDGQVLVGIAGRFYSEKEARGQVSDNLDDTSKIDTSQLFIGFGYADALAYLGDVEGEGDDVKDDGTFTQTFTVDPKFTKNFSLRDLTYVHLARNFADNFFQTLTSQTIFRDDFWGQGKDININNLQIERRVLSIRRLQLSIGKEGDSNNPKQVIYKQQAAGDEPNDYGVLPSLFILTNTSSAFTDFGLKGNKRWREYRLKNNLCSSK
ncbi:MAG: hypothetical protein OYH77_06350 [Pseudomonadota bacterium]|nr:hypothetical protein [Pseudomonadota bacterium]